jgi:hypothetical protein
MMHPGGGARAAALASDDVPRQEEPRQMHTLPSLAEQDWSPVPAIGELNHGQFPSGNGDARTINIIVVVCIRIRNLDRPIRTEWTLRCCAHPTCPTNTKTT